MSLVSPYDVFRAPGSPRACPVDSQVVRYLDLVAKYEPVMWNAYKPVRAHLFKMLFPGLQVSETVCERKGDKYRRKKTEKQFLALMFLCVCQLDSLEQIVVTDRTRQN